jgi:hypothetical protein
LLWLRSTQQSSRKSIHKKKKKKKSKNAKGLFRAHLFRDVFGFGVFGGGVGWLLSTFVYDRSCEYTHNGHYECHGPPAELLITMGVAVGISFAFLETAWTSPMATKSKILWIVGTAFVTTALTIRSVTTAPAMCFDHSDCPDLGGETQFCHRDGVCRLCAPRCSCAEVSDQHEQPQDPTCASWSWEDYALQGRWCEDLAGCTFDYETDTCRSSSMGSSYGSSLCVDVGLPPWCSCHELVSFIWNKQPNKCDVRIMTADDREPLPGCIDSPGFTDGDNGCEPYAANGWCNTFGAVDYGHGTAQSACCGCGGGSTGATTMTILQATHGGNCPDLMGGAASTARRSGTSGEEFCEEQIGVDQQRCEAFSECCHWNQGQCWSSIGTSECPLTTGDGEGADVRDCNERSSYSCDDTQSLRQACDGATSCSYHISQNVIGWPEEQVDLWANTIAPACSRAYHVVYVST